MTAGPLLSPVTIGGETITANSASQYVISGQTLRPGGPAITVDGTTVSLLPSATAIVVNGVTSTLSRVYGALVTTTASPLLTLNNKIYTANRAGYYILAPGTTLIPGGPPVTISGTVVSLEPKGTAAIIQGSTSHIQPLTTVVTLTRGHNGYGAGEGAGPYTSEGPGSLPQSTSSSKQNSAGLVRVSATLSVDGWLGGLFLLGMVGLGWLAVWL
jgi:cobalamin biosynthesis Mg chelatase CobN